MKRTLVLAGIFFIVAGCGQSDAPSKPTSQPANDKPVAVQPVPSKEYVPFLLGEVRGDGTLGRIVTLKLLREDTTVVLHMATAVLRADKSVEARKLKEAMEQEWIVLVAKAESAIAAGKVDDAVLALDKCFDWLVAKERDINTLLKVE